MIDPITIPFGPYRGKDKEVRKSAEYQAFAADLQRIQAGLDFRMGARDWCYYLEEHGLAKPDFDKAEKRIGNARKWGYLPVDFTLEDDARTPTGDHGVATHFPIARELESIWEEQIQGHLDTYRPFRWVDYQPYYIELLVEKKGLGSLFTKVAREFHFSISNGRGDTDILSIASMHRRFQEAEKRGQKPVLLYCGDHDPKGLLISENLHRRFQEAEGCYFKDRYVLEPINLTVDRFGLNLETIEELNLSKVPNLLTGAKGPVACTDGKKRIVPLDNPLHPDHRKPYVQNYLQLTGGEAWKVEANALVVRPEQGRELLRETVVRYTDMDAMAQYEADTQAAREKLTRLLPDFLQGKLDEA